MPLVLVLPIFELGPRASEDDPLAGDAPRADLAGVEVLDDVRRDQRGEHEDADGRVGVVADLVRALLAARERDDVALAQLLLALVRAQRRLAAEDDRPFLVRVVGVKWPLLVPRLDLVHARADQLGVGVRADPGVLEAPALALFRAIPLVCVEIEDLHAASLVARFGCYRTAGKQLPVPSETTSTVPSTTLMAVSSSIAYAGPDKPAAHRSAAAIVFVGRSGFSTCGKIENSTSPSASSPPSGGVQMTKSSPILGVITMLPALNPTQTVSSDGKRSANPDSRIQWHRYNESPPFTSRASVSLTRGTQSSSSMLGSAVSSSTPRDFQPNSIIGQRGSCPLMKFHALGGPAMGCPYDAVGMQRALDSAIGLPSRSTSASWMLVFLMPADVRRNFMPPPWSRCCRRERSSGLRISIR